MLGAGPGSASGSGAIAAAAPDSAIPAFYRALGRRVRSSRFLFMNYGFAQANADYGWLKAGDEPFRHHLALVRHVLAGVEVAGRKVLEIGGGRGGNCSYLARYTEAGSIYGIDLCHANIDLSRRIHRYPNVSFHVGDAQSLAFADSSLDIVLSLESCHCYPDLRAFLAEAHRVLRPGGVFCFTDLWGLDLLPWDWREREQILQAAPFLVDFEQDVSRQVCRALNSEGNIQSLLDEVTEAESRPFTKGIARVTRYFKHSLALGYCSYRTRRMKKRSAATVPRRSYGPGDRQANGERE